MSLDYSVIDTGNTDNGGENTDRTANQIHFNIEPVNDVPVAGEDSISVTEGQTISLTSIGNASLLDNDSDADGDTLTTQLIEAPKHGLFELAADGTFSYRHDGSETTSDEIRFIVFDGKDSIETTLSINILPENDAPQAQVLTDLSLIHI